MHLLLPIASILGIEVEDLIERFKQNAIAWTAIACRTGPSSSPSNASTA